jgi:drug/metabolite transporter (DMT)-like permease
VNTAHQFLGEGLALLSAVLWAGAVIFFRISSEKIHPISLNLFKNLIALILLIPTMYLLKIPLILKFPLNYYLLFIASGILGMTIADTLFFMSLARIGASLHAIIACSYSPTVVILSMIFLAERLRFFQILGTVFIILAVFMLTQIKPSSLPERKKLLEGILYGILSNLSTAFGIILIKQKLPVTPILWATTIRLLAGTLSLLIITVLFNNRKIIFSSQFFIKGFIYSLGGSFLGTYLALIVWLAGLKYTQVSVASILNQTSSIFIFLFAALFLKEKITLMKIVAIILAAIGVFLVFLGT